MFPGHLANVANNFYVHMQNDDFILCRIECENTTVGNVRISTRQNKTNLHRNDTARRFCCVVRGVMKKNTGIFFFFKNLNKKIVI